MPLPLCFKEQDGGTDADVERIGRAVHGYADVGIGGLAPGGGEAGALCAEDEGGGLAQVLGVVGRGVLQLGGEDAQAVALEVVDAGLAGAGHAGHAEARACRTADDVGVVQVAPLVAHDDGRGPCRIRTAQDGSQVARFLYAFEHDDERCRAQWYVLERERPVAHNAQGTLRRAAIGHFPVHGRRDVERFPRLGQGEAFGEFGAEHERLYLVACRHAALQLAPPFHHEASRAPPLLRLLLQAAHVLNACVLQAGDDGCFVHNNIKVTSDKCKGSKNAPYYQARAPQSSR